LNIEEETDIDPIVDIMLIQENEVVPKDYHVIDKTVENAKANLNIGNLLGRPTYLAYRRGKNEDFLVAIDVLENKDNLKDKWTIIEKNLSSGIVGQKKVYIIFKKSKIGVPIRNIVIKRKSEPTPKKFDLCKTNLNKGSPGFSLFIAYQKSFQGSLMHNKLSEFYS